MLSCIGASYVFTNQTSPAAIKVADTIVSKERNGVSIVDSSGVIRRSRSVAGFVGYRILITGIGGEIVGLLGSAEGISTKTKDDFFRKRGDDQWYGGGILSP